MRDGENGLMVNIGDPFEFADAFRRIQEDSALSTRLVAAGFQTLEQMFSVDAVVQAYMDLFVSRS